MSPLPHAGEGDVEPGVISFSSSGTLSLPENLSRAAPPILTAPVGSSSGNLVSADADRLSFGRKLCYACAGPALGWMGWLHEQLYNPIFVLMYGLSPATVSIIVGTFRVLDAFINPLMGWISDNTRTRWGRRRPYIIVGAILGGLWMPVMWMFPRDSSSTFIVAWLLIVGLVLTVFNAVFNMPYQTLQIELTTGIHERTSIGAYCSFLGKLGALAAGWTWFATQAPIFRDAHGKVDTLLGARWVFAGYGLAIIALGLICGIFTPERFYHRISAQKTVSLRENFRLVFANRHFRRMAYITVSFSTGAFLVTGLMFYLSLTYLFKNDTVAFSKMLALQTTFTFFTGLCGIPVFQWLSRHYGKDRALLAALFSIFVGSVATWWLANPAMPYLVMAVAVMTMPAQTGIWIMVPSMNADIVDVDELATGTRREGAFASIYSFVVNFCMSVGFMVSGPIVSLIGYNAAAGLHQAPGVILDMRIAVAVVPAITLLPALILLWRYPLTIEHMREVQTELVRRRGELTA